MSSRVKLRAVALAAVMVGSVFAVTAVPADGKLLSGGNAAVSQTGSAEDVVVNDATIDTSTSTTIEVAYDTTLATSDIAIQVTNDDTNDVIATKSSGFTAKEDTVSITIPDSSTTGVPDTSDFTLKATLADTSTSPPTPMASDTAAITVEPAPSISNVVLAESSDDMVAAFDADEQLGGNAGDVAVTVAGPNGATYTFDRTDFGETDNGDGTYTYSLATTQPYDDGDGTYSLSVDDALDPAGANGGNNGGGSGLGDSYSYSSSDTTSPAVSNVALGESSGDLAFSFDTDKQLGGNAGDLTVTVDSPNTGTDWRTFDRTDFAETDNGDGTYTYSLSTTQVYDDGDGVYTATVDDATDSAGNNGGVNGDGSGLSDSYDTSDTTAPSISGVSFAESSGNMDISFDSDEQLDTGTTDLIVEVTGPNGATYTFDRSQFFESGTGPYTYTLAVGQSFTDGDGTYTAEVTEARDSNGNSGGTNGDGSGLTDSHSYSDTTSPSVSGVTLDDSGTGTLTLAFTSDEQLGTGRTDAKVTVDAPNAGADWKTYYRRDFIETRLQNGNYRYSLTVRQGFDSGTGTYTAEVVDALDASGNNGGTDGDGSGLSDAHGYNPGSSTPAIVSKDVEYESGPAKYRNDAGVETNVHWNTRLDSQVFRFDLWVAQDELGATEQKRDLTLSPVGFNESTNVTLRMTVTNYNPDVVMGPANVSSWTVNDKAGDKKEIVVTLHPTVVQRNFNAPFDPSQWDSSKPGYQTSWEQADVGVNAFVGLQTASFGGGGGSLSKLSGARLNTDAQAFTTPSVTGGRLVFNVAAPHCKVGAKTDPNDPAADDECNSEYLNDDGFYEAVLPKAFWEDQWGSDLDPNNLSLVYKSDGTTETLTQVEMTKRASGDLYIEANGLHYSSADIETLEDTTDPTADAGSDATADEDTSVMLDGSSSTDGETSVTTYEWDIDGDGTYEKTGATPSHTYSEPGTYTVALRVTDDGQNTATDTVTVTVADVTAPSPSVGPDTTVNAGVSVSFDASGSTDNGGIASYEWDFDGDGTTDATGQTATHAFGSAGTYDVQLTVTDGAGNSDTATRTVTVRAEDGDGGSTTGPPVEIIKRPSRTDVVVRAHSGGVSVDLGRAGARTGSVAADGIAFDTTEPKKFTLNVSTPATSGDAPEPARTDVGHLVGYVQVDHSVSDDRVSDVRLNVTVDWDVVVDGPKGSEMVVYRYHDGEWVPLETSVADYSSRGIHLTGESPGLSVFAVGSEREAAFAVSDRRVESGTVATGDPVTVAATVTNDGTAVGERAVTLTSGEETLAVETVLLSPGESTTIEFTPTFDAPGEYDIRVDGASAGIVTVEGATTPSPTAAPEQTPTATPAVTPVSTATPPPTPTPTPDPATASDANGPGFDALAALVAVALAALAVARRRR